MMRLHVKLIALSSAMFVAGCTNSPVQPTKVDEHIKSELGKAASQRAREPENAKVQEALLPPLKMELPSLPARTVEPRFDIAVNNAPAAQVFMSVVSGTRYSMLVHPEVRGAISVNLKNVSVEEAL